MIYIVNILIAAILSFMSVSFFPYFEIFGVTPLLTIYFIVALAFFRKGFEPLAIAAFTGIFFDMFSANPFGFHLILFLVTAGIVRYLFQEVVSQLSFWYYTAISLGAIVFYYLVQYVILYIGGTRFTLVSFWPMIVAILVHAATVVIFYILFEKLFELEKNLESKLKRR